eukprot:TRINITY_DN67089_c0_g1_i1.p1 TRINITY_DN67089_c0_g1~~TRINITY_DN67089_c0_g1_i1.p1  ORF type:complete len:373 (+),score=53.50 TRINITY_DN67089_c0_g1_i1:84-1202(+)
MRSLLQVCRAAPSHMAGKVNGILPKRFAASVVGSADIRSKALGTINGIKPQVGHVRMVWEEGRWNEPIWYPAENTITLHLHASCLHYGGIAFEGLKAYEWRDGTVKFANAPYNAERLNLSAKRMGLPQTPAETFFKACRMAVHGNRQLVPSFESGETLYVRPWILASGPVLGVKIPCREFTFLVSVQPLGTYQDPSGINAVLAKHDRAAPRGTGFAKVGGNYGSSVEELQAALDAGFNDVLYLDPLTRANVDEFHGANFLAVSARNGAVVTPNSNTILESSTRRMLLDLARDEGLKVELRDVPVQEVVDGGLSELAGCGTSYVVTRLRSLTLEDGTSYSFGELSVLERLRQRLVAIHRGEAEDKFGWMMSAT